jgi:hypothetical protein
MLVGYRGYLPDRPMTDSAAIYMEPVLKAWGIPYYILMGDGDLPVIRRAFQQAVERSGPVVVLLGQEYEG